MRRRSVAAWAVALGLLFSAPRGLKAPSAPQDISGSILISAHVITTISDAGLRRSLTPVLGFDNSF